MAIKAARSGMRQYPKAIAVREIRTIKHHPDERE